MSSDYTPTGLSTDALNEADLMDVFEAHVEVCRETRGHKVNAWLDKLEARIEGGCSWKMRKNAIRMVQLNLEPEVEFAPEGTAALIEFFDAC